MRHDEDEHAPPVLPNPPDFTIDPTMTHLVWRYPDAPAEIRVLIPDGTENEWVTLSPASEEPPDWAPMWRDREQAVSGYYKLANGCWLLVGTG